MSKTQILQQHAKCILGNRNMSCLFRSYETLPAHIIPVLESCQKQGDQVKPSDLRHPIKNLLTPISFLITALEKVTKLGSLGFIVLRMFLVWKKLRMFFKTIPENMRDYSVYVVLLSSYTKSETTLDKAEATFEKIRELGFLMKPSPFNSMICLYCKLQNQDILEKLVSEMQETKVECDIPTVNNVLSVYAYTRKIKAMETFKTWVDERGIKLEGGTFIAMAEAYLTSGSIKNAVEMYGNVEGSEREVYRLWNEYKKEAKLEDDVYLAVISSLLKLNDVEGEEKIYGEWKPEGPKLDISIPGLLISWYHAEGMTLKVVQMLK